MASFRVFPEYRGVRVRPWMRKMNSFLFIFFFLLCCAFLAFYVYFNFDRYQQLDYVVIGYSCGYLVIAALFSFYLVWFLQEATPFFKKLDRLKRLSRYLFENGFVYQKKGKTNDSVRFPKVFLKQGKFELDVSFEMAGGKFQERFKKIGGALEDTFFMDFMETTDDVRFKNYKLAYSAFLNRIKISDVKWDLKQGIKLMNGFYWDFISDPHLLVAGGTGGGKTVLLRALLLCLSQNGAVDVCDPKRADFVTMADLPAFKNRIAFEKEAIIEKFETAVVIMMARYDYIRSEMKRLGHKDIKKFYDYGLEPYFFVCDEYNAFMSMLDYKERERVDNAFGQFILLGRQAGCFAVVAMQKPSAEDLGTKLQANIMFRISVGRLDDYGYEAMFGKESRNKEFRYIKYLSGRRVYGRGYACVFGEVAREFYSPLLTKRFSFYDAFEKVVYRENKFNPLENTTITAEILKDKELVAFANKVATEKERVEEEDLTDQFESLDLKTMASSLGKTFEQVNYLVKKIEEKNYHSFHRVDGELLFDEGDKVILKSLFELKEQSSDNYNQILKRYFIGE